MRQLAALLTTAALVLAGCGDDDEPGTAATTPTTSVSSSTTPVVSSDDQTHLDAAREQWRDAGIEDYELTWSVQCFCPTIAFVDAIEGGEVVEHRPAGDHERSTDPGPKTMEIVFDEVQDAIDADPHSLTVDYDPDNGAVLMYFVDLREDTVDEEYGLTVTLRTEADTGKAPEPNVSTAELTVDYPCGYGFQAGRPDQTAGLFFVRREPATSGTVTLPADGWNVRLQFGEDLFSNWCDDVQEPGEPTPNVTERWTVIAGTLHVTVPQQLQGEATLEATGLIAERPDGTRIDLEDLTVTNEHYGTVAG